MRSRHILSTPTFSSTQETEASIITIKETTGQYADPYKIERLSPTQRQGQHQILILRSKAEVKALHEMLSEILEVQN